MNCWDSLKRDAVQSPEVVGIVAHQLMDLALEHRGAIPVIKQGEIELRWPFAGTLLPVLYDKLIDEQTICVDDGFANVAIQHARYVVHPWVVDCLSVYSS